MNPEEQRKENLRIKRRLKRQRKAERKKARKKERQDLDFISRLLDRKAHCESQDVEEGQLW